MGQYTNKDHASVDSDKASVFQPGQTIIGHDYRFGEWVQVSTDGTDAGLRWVPKRGANGETILEEITFTECVARQS